MIKMTSRTGLGLSHAWMIPVAFLLVVGPLSGATPHPAKARTNTIFYRFVEPVTEQQKYPVIEALRQTGYDASIVFRETTEAIAGEIVIDVSSSEFVMPLNLEAVEIAHVHGAARFAATKICFDVRWFRGYHGGEKLYAYALQEIQTALSIRGREARSNRRRTGTRTSPGVRCDNYNSAMSADGNAVTLERCYVNTSLLDRAVEVKPLSGITASSDSLTPRVLQDLTAVWIGPPARQLAVRTPQHPPGTNKSQLAYLNNNPGNLRRAPGAAMGSGGFATFRTLQDGYCAYESYVVDHAERGLTLAQYIQKYAPPIENRTGEYLNSAVRALHVPEYTRLIDIPIMRIAEFQLMLESGTLLSGPGLDEPANPACEGVTIVSRVANDSARQGVK